MHVTSLIRKIRQWNKSSTQWKSDLNKSAFLSPLSWNWEYRNKLRLQQSDWWGTSIYFCICSVNIYVYLSGLSFPSPKNFPRLAPRCLQDALFRQKTIRWNGFRELSLLFVWRDGDPEGSTPCSSVTKQDQNNESRSLCGAFCQARRCSEPSEYIDSFNPDNNLQGRSNCYPVWLQAAYPRLWTSGGQGCARSQAAWF